MQKRVLAFGIIFLALVLTVSMTVTAQTSCTDDTDCESGYECNSDGECEEIPDNSGTPSSSNTDQDKIDKAYEWLEEQVEDVCDDLTIEEQIFSLLALKHHSSISSDCEDALAPEDDMQCWPDGNCNIKTTAQAILALDSTGYDTDEAIDWLKSQNTTPTDLIWYLEIDSDVATTCTITYGGGAGYSINIGEDKKVSGSAGSCLSPAMSDYWLKISPSCYDLEFSISCTDAFLTTLLYQKQGSSTIYVSEKVTDAPAEASTKEKINSFCFKQGSSCTYEGSLWAARVLDALGEPVSPFIPYLIATSDDYNEFLPSSFLYSLTNQVDFRTSLLAEQVSNQYWDESGDKFYDTAVAMFSLYGDEIPETTGAKEWLLLTQDEDDGSWRRNIRNTAFILASVWPKKSFTNGPTPTPDCEDSGYYCVPGTATCSDAGGTVKDNYRCGAVGRVCCTAQETLKTCSELSGIICPAGKECSITSGIVPSVDGDCCVGGVCQDITGPTESECERLTTGGCYGSCNTETEDEKPEYDCDFGVCCVPKSGGGDDDEPWPWWIWLLIVLIVLVVIGIIFRKKLQALTFRVKSKVGGKKKGPPGLPPPGMMPGTRRPGMPTRMGPRPMPRRPGPAGPRRILPPGATRRPTGPRPRPKPTTEMDEVLKKLKDMGKKK